MWSSSWIGLLLTVTDISTTCAVVIFRIKASCITSVNGNKLWLLTWLVKVTANSVYGKSAFKIMPDTNFAFNQKQIPGSILGRWGFLLFMSSSNLFPCFSLLICFVFFFSKEAEKMSSATTLSSTWNAALVAPDKVTGVWNPSVFRPGRFLAHWPPKFWTPRDEMSGFLLLRDHSSSIKIKINNA